MAARFAETAVISAFAAGFAIASTACSSGSDAPTHSGGDAGMLGVPVGPCAAVTEQHAIEGAGHVPSCSEVSYGTNPPSSGNHYGVWAAFQSYTFAVPRGF